MVASGLALPAFFRYYASPVKMVEVADGGMAAWRVSIDTGGWLPANDIVGEILTAVGGEIWVLDVEDFVQEVERYRGHYLSGDGPIFALYETVEAIVDAEVRENRRLTPSEVALIRGIRRRTFVMFEEELRRAGDPGADPSIAS